MGGLPSCLRDVEEPSEIVPAADRPALRVFAGAAGTEQRPPPPADLYQQITEIFAREWDRLFAYAFRLTHSREKAEDALLEALLQASSLTSLPDEMLPYLFAVLRHIVTDQHRSELRFHRPRHCSPEEDGSDPQSLAIRAETILRVHAAVDALPPRYREVLKLHYWTGMTLREIAEALHEPLATIRTRYRRALASLRRVLSEKISTKFEAFRAR